MHHGEGRAGGAALLSVGSRLGRDLDCSAMEFRTTKGTTGPNGPSSGTIEAYSDCAALQLFPCHGRGGFRTCDLSRVKQESRKPKTPRSAGRSPRPRPRVRRPRSPDIADDVPLFRPTGLIAAAPELAARRRGCDGRRRRTITAPGAHRGGCAVMRPRDSDRSAPRPARAPREAAL
jgi:hypothetical protein